MDLLVEALVDLHDARSDPQVRETCARLVTRYGGAEAIDLEDGAGEVHAIMGPNGSGKSTFFNMVGALDSPTAGRVFIDEVDVAQLTAEELAYLRCHKIGYIFQTYNILPGFTALENVSLPMIFAGVTPDDAREKAAEILERSPAFLGEGRLVVVMAGRPDTGCGRDQSALSGIFR